MGWEILILSHALFSALGTLQARGIARLKHARQAALFVNAITFASLFMAGLLLLPFIGGVDFNIAKSQWAYLVASAVFFNFGLFYLYRALVYLESATAAVLATSSALFTMLFARIVFQEELSSTQLIGTAVLVPCIAYVLALARSRQKFVDFKDLPWLKGAMYVMVSSLSMALGHIMEKVLLREIGIGNFVAFGWLLQATFGISLFLLFGNKSKKIIKDKFIIRSAMSVGVLRVAAALLFLYALKASDNLSIVMVVSNFRIIIVAVLAGWLLGEKRYYYKKLAAAALSLVGLSIIFWA